VAIDISMSSSPHFRKTIHATFDDQLSQQAMVHLMEEIVRQISERYVKENYASIVSNLDPVAISNLSIAEAGKHIAQQIAARPIVLHDKETRTKVFERGFFGGTRRVR
jgi:hypothetical protein